VNRRNFLLAAPAFILARRLDFGVPRKLVLSSVLVTSPAPTLRPGPVMTFYTSRPLRFMNEMFKPGPTLQAERDREEAERRRAEDAVLGMASLKLRKE